MNAVDANAAAWKIAVVEVEHQAPILYLLLIHRFSHLQEFLCDQYFQCYLCFVQIEWIPENFFVAEGETFDKDVFGMLVVRKLEGRREE